MLGAMIVIAAFAWWAIPARAEGGEPALTSAGIETETNSRYVWHGLAFSEGAVLQSTVSGYLGALTASAWFNQDLQYRSTHLGLNEVDFSLAYTAGVGSLVIEPSLQYYGYPYQTESPGTAEAGLELAYPIGDFTLRTYHSLDIKEYPRAYYGDAGLAWALAVSERSSMEFSATYGWASQEFAMAYLGEAPDRFHLAAFQASYTQSLSAWLYIRPHLAFSSLRSAAYSDIVEAPDLWQVGVALGSEFGT